MPSRTASRYERGRGSADTRALLDWQLFNALVGNSDGHAKNLSLLYEEGSCRLAPFYDLVCTRAYPRLSRALAMALGGEHDPGKLLPRHLDELARETGTTARYLRDRVAALAAELEDLLGETMKDFAQRYGKDPVLQLVPPVIRKLARATARRMAFTPEGSGPARPR